MTLATSALGHVRRLAQRLAARAELGLLSVPGCWDGLSVLLIENAGFEAAFVSGGVMSMARLGRPDVGLLTGPEVIDTVALLRDRTDLPLIVDGDTGYGNALTLQRFVRGVERAGASAIQIEDQTFPKRCGHMAGKAVVPLAAAQGRIRAALDARDHALIAARTDALAIEGVDAALDRAEAFLEEGADLVFVEGPRTTAELHRVADRFADRVPLVHNLVEGGVSPTRSGRELEAAGFAVALHPLLLMHGFVAGADGWLDTLRRDQSTEALERTISDLSDMNALTGARALQEATKHYGC